MHAAARPGKDMAARAMIERIVIETETPGDSRTMFRVLMDRLVIGENLTAAQAHLIVGEVLDRITLPRPAKKHSEHSWAGPRGETVAAPYYAPPGQERSARAARF
jgi:hypothetical protein